MIKYDFRSTHYMVEHHFDTTANTEWFIKAHTSGKIKVKTIEFFPNDIIIIKLKNSFNAQGVCGPDYGRPAGTHHFKIYQTISTLKYLWDIGDKNGKSVIKKQIQRSHHTREEYMSINNDEKLKSWYIAIYLGEVL